MIDSAVLGTRKLVCVAVVGFVFGSIMLIAWIPRVLVADSPIVSGAIRERAPIVEWGVPRVRFTIEVSETSETVHAYTQRYLQDRIPAQVRFRYSGDPTQRVYLFEHEENPLWIGLFCWTVSAFLGGVVYRRRLSAGGGESPN